MSYYLFMSTIMVCIYLAIIASSMKDGTIVWVCSVSLFSILMIRLLIFMVKAVWT